MNKNLNKSIKLFISKNPNVKDCIDVLTICNLDLESQKIIVNYLLHKNNIFDLIELIKNVPNLDLELQEKIINEFSKFGFFNFVIEIINNSNINELLQSKLINSITYLDEILIVELLNNLNKIPYKDLVKLINKLCESDKNYYKLRALKSKLLTNDLYYQLIDSIFKSDLRIEKPHLYIEELVNLYLYNEKINIEMFKMLIIKYNLIDFMKKYNSLFRDDLKLKKEHEEKLKRTKCNVKILDLENYLKELDKEKNKQKVNII